MTLDNGDLDINMFQIQRMNYLTVQPCLHGKKRIYNMFITKKLYFDDAKLCNATATIVAINNDESAIILDQTIFHPRGGGQPADEGHINDIMVCNVINNNDTILHVVSPEHLSFFSIGAQVNLNVNKQTRHYHARLHTAGHLLAAVVEKIYPSLHAETGNHIPGQTRVVFTGTNFPEKIDEFIQKIDAALKKAIQDNNAIKMHKEDNGKRFITIENYNTTPCGGTHIEYLSELGEVTIRKVSKKGDLLQVGYQINPEILDY
jgi:Ser-tRNA(Ala) deacylase AlaX